MKKYLPRLLCFAAALIVSFAGLLRADEQPAQPILDYPRGSDALPLLREIWDFGARNVYPNTLAERFDPITLKQLEESLISDDKIALADVLNPFLDSLGVSHTRFYDRRHQGYYLLRSLFSTRDIGAPQLYTIGVQLNDENPGLVQAVLEGSPAAAVNLRRGDRIVAVDGVPFESLLQWQQAVPVRLEIETESGVRQVRLKPILQSFHRALAKATEASKREIRCRDRRIGYLHLWSGTNDVFLDALKDAIAEAKASRLDAFVLDLRDGYGGAWWPYLDPFYPDRTDYFTFKTFGPAGESDTNRAEPKINPGAWRGPVAAIINGGTRSGKESLAFQFRRSGRAKLFGTATNGAFTSGLGVFAERDADYILFLAVSELRLDGTVIEGVGVSPDVVVPDEPDRDAPLEAALAHLDCQFESN